MKRSTTLVILTMAATCSGSALADNDCQARKKAIDEKLSSRGLQNYTLTIVADSVSVPGKIVGRCDNKKRKIIYTARDVDSGMIEEVVEAGPSGDVRRTADARIATDAKAAAAAKAAVDVKAAAAAKAASEAAAADARAASAANAAAEAKAAANRAAAEARAAAIEAKAAAEARAAAAAKAAAESRAAADAAAGEAKAAAEAKTNADAWAATAAKTAADAAAAATKAAADAKLAADLKAAANARVTAAELKAAADARVAANARAAADALDPADAAGLASAMDAPEVRTASVKAAPAPAIAPVTAPAAVAVAVPEVKAPAESRAATGPKLQYDGLYRASINVNGRLFWKYFRFYPDGAFITVRSIGTPEQLRSWFVRDEPNNERGTFKLQGARILFFTPQGETANYEGSIEGDQVRINIHSQTAQNQRSDVYEFVKWSDDRGNTAATAQKR